MPTPDDSPNGRSLAATLDLRLSAELRRRLALDGVTITCGAADAFLQNVMDAAPQPLLSALLTAMPPRPGRYVYGVAIGVWRDRRDILGTSVPVAATSNRKAETA